VKDKSEPPAWDEAALARLHEMVADSSVFLSLFTENYKRDPTALVQLVFALMLDKPIYLLVPRGVPVPKGMRRLADGIEEWDLGVQESLERATARLINRARSDGRLADGDRA
jgi:hypothetical protein